MSNSNFKQKKVITPERAAIILPTMHTFINSRGGLFLEGYETESIVGQIYQKSFILCWIRGYHLVCRDCYHTFRRNKLIAVLWLLTGSACVLIYVSSAYAFHMAFVSFMKIEILD